MSSVALHMQPHNKVHTQERKQLTAMTSRPMYLTAKNAKKKEPMTVRKLLKTTVVCLVTSRSDNKEDNNVSPIRREIIIPPVRS